ncbi:hypothetical protein CLF_108580 [Clonorchis sinensis]|uniref:Uncharacterized protein n=1 Tax=Clonorchis sinensis TaxID=79923 RepID=G7YRS5_CLOSI|nr:hypothetical protein CLF_108580 [Clonorchis sinensis]
MIANRHVAAEALQGCDGLRQTSRMLVKHWEPINCDSDVVASVVVGFTDSRIHTRIVQRLPFTWNAQANKGCSAALYVLAVSLPAQGPEQDVSNNALNWVQDRPWTTVGESPVFAGSTAENLLAKRCSNKAKVSIRSPRRRRYSGKKRSSTTRALADSLQITYGHTFRHSEEGAGPMTAALLRLHPFGGHWHSNSRISSPLQKRLLDPKSPSAISPLCSKKQLRTRKPSSKPLHFSRPAKTVSQATSDCSVVLTDISLPHQPGNTLLSPLPVGSEALNDLENLRTRMNQTKNEMSALRTIQSIACPLNPDATRDPTNLEKASILIDTIASEICQHIECRHQVRIFNAPDRIPLEHTKTAILTACGMQDTICIAQLLRKSKPSMRCPIIMQFQDEKNAARLLTAQTVLSSTKKFQTLKIKAARTRVQRQLTKKLPELVAPSTSSTCADACHNVTQSCLFNPGPTPHTHDHEPSTSISGHPQMLSPTSATPKRPTADLGDKVTTQPIHETVVEDDSTDCFSRPPDLMTLRVSSPKRFLGLKHLLSKPCTITPSPEPTPQAPALHPSSTNLTIPVIPHKRICSPTKRTTQFPYNIFKPQLPLPNLSPYQAPPL